MSIKAMKLAAIASSVVVLAGLALTPALTPALAQQKAAPATTTTVKGSFDGFGLNGSDPIQLESDAADVDDAKNLAILTGNVVARQNKSALRCKVLNVYYTERGAAAPASGGNPGSAASPGQQDGRKIKRLVADQNVLVTSDNQTASGDHAEFDTINRIVVMTGNVVLTQGKDVVRGDKLTVNLVTNTAKVESNHRVQMLVDPNQSSAPTTATPKR